MNEKKSDSEVTLTRLSFSENDFSNKKLEFRLSESSNSSEESDKNLNIIQNSWLNSRFKIYKNLIVIGLAWMFQFTAYGSMANLQSSLNIDGGLGTASLSTIYVTLILSCLFVPPFMINHIGLKWTIVISQVCYLLFIAANMYPKWYILIPAGVVLGIGAAPLWTAKCTYLTEISFYYSRLNGANKDAVMSKFFGIFFAMFQTTQIWGNVISSTVLKANNNHTGNDSDWTRYCGSSDCPGTNRTASIVKPLMSTVYTLCGIYIGLTLIGILFIIIFLNGYYRESLNQNNCSSQCSLVIGTLKHLKNRSQILVIPLTLWSGFSQAFITADYAKSFVNCLKGVNFVGYTLICYGVADTLGSYLFGYLSKFVGRIPCFIVSSLLNFSMIFLMIFWKAKETEIYVLFLIPIFWGLADSCWQTQIHSLYGSLFHDKKEEAFSNFRLWESLGFAISYAYSSVLCCNTKLYLLIVYLSLGLLCYTFLEILNRYKSKKTRKNKIDEKNEREIEDDECNERKGSDVPIYDSIFQNN